MRYKIGWQTYCFAGSVRGLRCPQLVVEHTYLAGAHITVSSRPAKAEGMEPIANQVKYERFTMMSAQNHRWEHRA